MSKVETDHEFKTRMAAEGRAIYVPGKTDEQIVAEKERKAAPKPVTLHLSENDLDMITRALPQAYDLISDLARACDYLGQSGMSDAWDGSEISPLFRLFARACRGAECEEMEALFKLDMKFRDAVKSEGA
ncbi:hypothetical protein [Roseinatronobacter sp.]|uniref:hypothetical protein n=1 Tax=Roseinatronobacter sp. TaxID=1945755 RepID=UPI0025E111DE|nr:hypothetical protein [Roseibaca sp.]